MKENSKIDQENKFLNIGLNEDRTLLPVVKKNNNLKSNVVYAESFSTIDILLHFCIHYARF